MENDIANNNDIKRAEMILQDASEQFSEEVKKDQVVQRKHYEITVNYSNEH